MDASKLEKKLRRKLLQVSQKLHNCNLSVSNTPTTYVFVGNGGMECGISKELLVSILDKDRCNVVSMIHTTPVIDSVIVEFNNIASSEQTVNKFNGCCVQEQILGNNLSPFAPNPLLSGPPVHLLMTYLLELPLAFCATESVDILSVDMSSLPPGCHLVDNFITNEEEIRLIDFFACDSMKVRESLYRCIEGESTFNSKGTG